MQSWNILTEFCSTAHTSTAFHLDADKLELNFKLKNYQRASEILCELLANVEDRCLQQSFKNAKMLMLCLKASLLLSKVQNIQGQLASSTQVPFKNIIENQYGPELTKSMLFLMQLLGCRTLCFLSRT